MKAFFRRPKSGFFNKPRSAHRAGYLYFSPASGHPQPAGAVRAFKNPVCLPILEVILHPAEPPGNRIPKSEERLIFTVPLGCVAGKHAHNCQYKQNHGNQGQNPKTGNLGNQIQHQISNQKGVRKLIGAIASHHPLSESIHSSAVLS